MLTLNLLVSMPSARIIKVNNKKYYKSNSESIRSRKRDNYQNNPQNKKDASRAKLDALSAQLIQLAKCYQTVARLGTYTGKVPIYNSLKACNGTMFFLPLPLNKTLDTLHQANFSGKAVSALPDPELYIIVNGKPTKSKIVWYSLVNVANINASVCKLQSSKLRLAVGQFPCTLLKRPVVIPRVRFQWPIKVIACTV